jgi:hypothetical protein
MAYIWKRILDRSSRRISFLCADFSVFLLFKFISQIEVRTIFQWTEALFHFYVLYWNIVLLIRICGVKVALECRHDLTQRALQGGFLGDSVSSQGAVAPVSVRTESKFSSLVAESDKNDLSLLHYMKLFYILSLSNHNTAPQWLCIYIAGQ